MPLDPKSEAGRLRAIEIQFRQQVAFEKAFEVQLAKEFNKTALEASESYIQTNLFDGAMTQHTIRLDGIIKGSLDATWSFFGDISLAEIGQLSAFGLPLGTRDVFRSAQKFYVDTIGARRVTQVSTTTRKLIAKVISTGQRESLAIHDIAKLISKKTGGSIGRKRALRIARTETHSAAVASDFEAVKSTGLQFEKEWLTFLDGRTRNHHKSADGQVRRKEQPFDVDGQELMYPGDPAGRASNIINCRCQALYNIIR